ncbi:MAG TPA: class I SAM-dependent methyltransferase [Solirubrobacterales bacterium]|nr:class I SAM-dependent methyltransferase [Solirubrobacterales bacterium]
MSVEKHEPPAADPGEAGDDNGTDKPAPRPGPPRRIRLIGRTLTGLVSHMPFLWPLLRRPMRSYFDERADGWDERTDAPGPSHLAPLAVAVTKIDRHPERALDLGTGTGVAALFVAREFPRASVRGCDISEEMIRRATAKVGLDPEGRVAFKVADAADLPWPDEHFDLVTQLNMPAFFGETARVLRHGGHVIVAASSGERTPFYTPDSVLERGFRRHGFVTVTGGRIGSGTYYVARKGE